MVSVSGFPKLSKSFALVIIFAYSRSEAIGGFKFLSSFPFVDSSFPAIPKIKRIGTEDFFSLFPFSMVLI
jgi:hypothetical protein